MPIKTRVKKKEGQALVITSLLDMFTILLLYLLKNFSSEGEVVTVSPNLILPESNAQKDVKSQKVLVAVTANNILVNGKIVISMQELEEGYEGIPFVPPLKDQLEEERETEFEMVRVGAALQFEGRLVLSIDKKVPFKVIYKVMATCGEVGYTKMDLAVFKLEAPKS
jgi:biopolymer transport protein ExbD